MKNMKTHAQKIISLLEKEYPLFETALDFEKDWQLLIAVLLSAQTTDENVNRVTKTLFRTYASPKSIAKAPLSQLEKAVFSTGYYRAKARNMQNMCKMLVETYKGNVPDTMEELVKLPGVGRKTANVILHVLYGKTEGIVMDTHIARLTQRLGFIEKKDPVKAERIMMSILPQKEWKIWGDLLIQHGRNICHARKPDCPNCVLNNICPSARIEST